MTQKEKMSVNDIKNFIDENAHAMDVNVLSGLLDDLSFGDYDELWWAGYLDAWIDELDAIGAI